MAASESTAFIASVQAKADTAISRLESTILSNLDAFVHIDGNIDGYDFSEFEFTAPSVPDLTLFNFISGAVFENLDSEKRTGHVWSANEMAAIQTAIFNSINSGGIGISQALQDSIFNSDRERKLQALNDSLTLINAGMGARGFRMPNSMLAGQRNEVIRKYQDDLENQSREITKLMEEHARANWQFCIQQGINSEQFYSDFTKSYKQLFIEVIKASLEKYRTSVEVDVQKYKARIEGILAKLEAEKVRAEVQSVAWKSMIDKARVEIELQTASTKAGLEASSINAADRGRAMAAYAELVGRYATMASGGSIKIEK